MLNKCIQSKWADLLALVAGALLTLAYAPFNYYLLAPVLPAVLLILWHGVNTKRILWRAWLFGFGYFGTGVSWVYISIHVYGYTPVWLAIIMTTVFVAFLGLFFLLQTWLLQKLFKTPGYSKILIGFPCTWILVEWFRSWILTGFPWLLLGYSQTDSSLGLLAPIIGVYGIGFLVLLSSGLIYITITKSWRIKIIALISILIIWLSPLTLRNHQWSQAIHQPLTVSLLQGNIAQQDKWQADNFYKTVLTYHNLTIPQLGRDIVIWPEAAVPGPLWVIDDEVKRLDNLSKQLGSTLIIGAPEPIVDGQTYYNAMYVLGDSSGVYHKRQLVPFGEYVPFESWIRGLVNFFNVPMSSFVRGHKQQSYFHTKGIKMAPFICYEIAYGNLVLNAAAKANVLLTISDDSWFGDSHAQDQHVQIGRLRAMETSRDILFATNDGVTALINHKGHITQAIPKHTTSVLSGTAQARTGATPIVTYGQSVIILILLLLMLIGIRCNTPK